MGGSLLPSLHSYGDCEAIMIPLDIRHWAAAFLDTQRRLKPWR